MNKTNYVDTRGRRDDYGSRITDTSRRIRRGTEVLRMREFSRWACRVAISSLRRRIPSLRLCVISVGHGVDMEVDLTTAFGLGLFRYGLSNPELILLERLLDEGDMFIDGGAHVGTFALVAARIVGPSGSVLAFEPAFHTADALARNIRLNGFTWCELRRGALTEQIGDAEFVEILGEASGLSGLAPLGEQFPQGESIKVPTTCLDSLCTSSALKFVKLDVEGAEVRVLRGASEMLSSAQPHLLIEISDALLRRQGSSSEEIDSILGAHGYSLWEQVIGAPQTLRHLAHSRSLISGPNIFATARPAEVSSRGFVMVEE